MFSLLTQLKDNLCPIVQIIIYFIFFVYSEIEMSLKFNRKPLKFYIFMLWLHPRQTMTCQMLTVYFHILYGNCSLAVSHLGWHLECPIRFQRWPVQSPITPLAPPLVYSGMRVLHWTTQKAKGYSRNHSKTNEDTQKDFYESFFLFLPRI